MPKVYNKYKDKGKIPKNARYCGRGSKYGNPYIIGIDGDRDEVCDKYTIYADIYFTDDEIRKDLGGRDLVCFCAPLRCHCDYLLRRANK